MPEATSPTTATTVTTAQIPLRDFNELNPEAAAAVLRPCLDVGRWVDQLLGGRPYPDLRTLLDHAGTAASPLTAEEIDAALAHHPRIGQRAAGFTVEAGLSRSEQSGLDLGEDVHVRLREGNQAYEQRFGHVFLIRAAGRSTEQILAALESRLGNDPGTEREVVAGQLREIAVLRLSQVVAP